MDALILVLLSLLKLSGAPTIVDQCVAIHYTISVHDWPGDV
jgi:hypothetical protein